MPAIAELFIRVGADIGGAVTALKGLNSNLEGFASTAGAALPASVALAGAGAGIAAGFAKGIASAGDLEQAVANISTIKPEIDAGGVFSALNDMSRRVPQTSAQLGDALYNVFSSIEAPQADALTLVEKFAKGAVGAQTDALTFGTSVLGVMNAYGLAVSDADHISDVFFNTVNKGVVTGAELAASLGPVTQSAKSAGVNFDTLGGLIAGVTKEGGPAAQNINNLSNFLAKVNSKDAVKGFTDLGVSLTDANGEFRPLLDVLTDAKGALDRLAPAVKNASIQNIFQDFQARQGFQTLLSQLDFVKGAVAANRGEVGSAASAYQTMASTFNSQTQLLSNNFTALLTTVGGKLLPVVEKLTLAISGLLEGFQALPEPVQTGIAALIGITGLLAGISGAIGLAAFALAPLIAGFAALAPIVGVVLAALAPLALPILAIGAAVGLLAAAWQNNWGDIQGITQRAFEAIRPTLNALGELFGALGNLAGALAQRFGTELLGALGQVGAFLNSTLRPAFEGLLAFLGELLGKIGGVLDALLPPEVRRIFDQIGGAASGLPGAVGTLTTGVNAAADAVRGSPTVNSQVTVNATLNNEADEKRLAETIAETMLAAANRVIPPVPQGQPGVVTAF